MIRIEDLTVAFGETEAVKHVNLELKPGEILGVVGESGSGKSVTALTLMGLISEEARITTGRILFDDVVLAEAGRPKDKALYRKYQGDRMSMIFQEPMTSLNPTWKVGRQVEETLRLHRDLSKEERRRQVLDAFTAVGLRDVEKVYGSYPHELSGGMRQRVMIAMAVILHPGLIVADEPTTALDVTIQNQIIELLRKINSEQKNTMLFITHDLNLARRICQRIAVMKDGRVVETGPTEEIFETPREAYTRRLIQAVPSRIKKTRKTENAVSPDKADNILEVRDLNVYYREGGNSLFAGKRKHCVVENATFDIKVGEILGLVGESGCGKTSLSKAILRMNKNIQGSIVCREPYPQMIFQDPYSSLNPVKTVGWLLKEPLRALGRLDPSREMTEADMEAAAYDMLRKVGMEESYFHRRPSQLSGGQRQRISIGQALITRPRLVIADEPVSALDVTMQAQIMELMLELQEELKLSYLFISHDINVIYRMSDRIMVMQRGRIVEIGDTEGVFRNPGQEYTKLLLKES
ncbi:MAG: ABC transporter ATP-binding protein [Lachnospiraceae bacterium]|nr:ABC transporter ATP-binding protein [Lachnospiraceae bacterium]